jgi:hypothetical protein
MRRLPPLPAAIWILRQEYFDQDYAHFLDHTGLDFASDGIFATTDPLAANRRDYGDVPPFSENAYDYLRRWYAQDFVFVDMCHHWLEERV